MPSIGSHPHVLGWLSQLAQWFWNPGHFLVLLPAILTTVCAQCSHRPGPSNIKGQSHPLPQNLYYALTLPYKRKHICLHWAGTGTFLRNPLFYL